MFLNYRDSIFTNVKDNRPSYKCFYDWKTNHLNFELGE